MSDTLVIDVLGILLFERAVAWLREVARIRDRAKVACGGC
jgi:hypothetical protein